MEIRAIQTRYNGYRFRSRLEARWAVWFDTLKIDYRYELEGLVLSNGMTYLPDFYLPQLGVWIEIKPFDPAPQSEELLKLELLAAGTQQRAFLFTDVWPRLGAAAIEATPEAYQTCLPVGSTSDDYWRTVEECEFRQKGECEECPKAVRSLGFADIEPYRAWCECPRCGCLGIGFQGWPKYLSCGCMLHEGYCETYNAPRLMAAYIAAREARFEMWR